MNKELKEIWRETLSLIQLSISKTHFKAWFSNSSLDRIVNGEAIIFVKNNIAREYFENEFYQIVKQSLETAVNEQIKVKFVVAVHTKINDDPLPPLFGGEKNLNIVEQQRLEEQYLQAVKLLGLNTKYTFDNFVVGSSNRLAHAAALAVSENPGHAYNPLFIYGDVGLGKTHLIQAIANHILQNDPTFKIVYCSSEVFLNEMVSAIRTGTQDAFRKRYREKNLLIIDDIQFIESRKGTQEEIFHTFNSMYQFNKQIVIVSDRPPEDMPFLESRLRSRFEGGMVVDVNKPEFETRLAILQKKCEERSYNVSKEVLEFIAQKYNSNVRELEGILMKLGSLNTLGKEMITMTDAVDILGAKAIKKGTRILPSDIINAVCSTFNVLEKDLKGTTRTDEVAFSRQIAMYLLRKELSLPLHEVARILNRKDHSTVLHAIDKVELLRLHDDDLRYEIDTLVKELKT